MSDKTATTHSPISVANYLLKKNGGMQQLKLLKLVYLCHAWHLGILGEPLVNEEAEARSYGPVFPSLDRATEGFDQNFVDSPLAEKTAATFDSEQKKLMKLVYEGYGKLEGIQLMAMSGRDGSPWLVVRDGGNGANAKIPNQLIQQHYAEKYNAE